MDGTNVYDGGVHEVSPLSEIYISLMDRRRKVSRVQEKVAHFSPGETAYQDSPAGSDKVPVGKEMIYEASFALTLTLIYCFYTSLNNVCK